MTPADRATLLSLREAGASVQRLASRFALGVADIRRELDMAITEASHQPPEPSNPTPEEPAMPKPRTCKTPGCTRQLGLNNRSGICSPCQRPKGKKPKQRPPETKKRIQPRRNLELPGVSELPADYLAACVAEARRRVADAAGLREALADS